MALSQPDVSSLSAAADAPSGVLFLSSPSRERVVGDRLGRTGVPIVRPADLAEALAQAALRRFAVCLIDLAADRVALSAIRLFRSQFPQQPLAGIIDPANPLATGQALHAGLQDLLPWPFEDRDLLMLTSNALDRHGLEIEITRPGSAAEALFAQAPSMRPVLDKVHAAAAGSGGICITGEPGTGRELIARVIHALSRDEGSAPFVMVDCHDLPRTELEQRLFGVISARATAARTPGPERIAPTGAIARARGGTLYLAGLLEAPVAVQAKLARLLRDGEALLLEPDEEIPVDLDVRPVGSFEPGVEAAVGDGRLRRDLLDRLAHVRIEVPPLRRRRQDIPLLAVHFLDALAEADGQPAKLLSRSALALLSALPWNGNAGELRTLLETVGRSVRRPIIEIDDVLEHAALDGTSARIEEGTTLREARARFERECISAVLMRHHGRVGEAAKALGIQRTNLYRKVRQLDVSRSLLLPRR